ncbi:MAG: MerR family transcriptional regulator [Myxococcales bacterium]|nr:MerR family transcriptional regulator [Myxococcales bacterium]
MNAGPELVKMAVLAKRSGVPAATIKHYLREGLIPGPVRRTARNMAYYDAGVVERIVTIKRLQRDHFLPLNVIREVLDGTRAVSSDGAAALAIARVLRKKTNGEDTRTRAELLAAGVRAEDLSWLEGIGLVNAEGEGDEARYGGDDLAILRVLGAARRAGIAAEMLPVEVLEPYARAIRELVRAELALFRDGVLPRAGQNVEELTEVATLLSEQLVVLLRRKLLLPTLAELAAASPRRANKRSNSRSKK